MKLGEVVSVLALLVCFISVCGREVGIMMCEENCTQLKGCIGYLFQTVHLHCRCLTEKPRVVLSGNVVTILPKGQRRYQICSTKDCQTGRRCIRNRAKRDVCDQGSGITNKTEAAGTKEPRLFVIHAMVTKETRFQQYNLQTRQIKYYQHINILLPASLCYLPLSRRLLISTTTPNRLLSHRINSNITSVLQKGLVFNDLAVDEKRQLLFSVVTHGSDKLHRISISSRKVKTFHLNINGEMPRAITIDSSIKVLYVSFASWVQSVSYEGKIGRRVLSAPRIYTLSFEPRTKTLYFSSNALVLQRQINGKISRVVKLPGRPKSIKYFNGRVVASTAYKRSRNNLYFIFPSKKTFQTVIFYGDGEYLLFCFVL